MDRRPVAAGRAPDDRDLHPRLDLREAGEGRCEPDLAERHEAQRRDLPPVSNRADGLHVRDPRSVAGRKLGDRGWGSGQDEKPDGEGSGAEPGDRNAADAAMRPTRPARRPPGWPRASRRRGHRPMAPPARPGPIRPQASRSRASANGDEVAQLVQDARPDDLALAQLVDGRKGFLCPRVDDLLGGDRADTRQLIELGGASRC